MHELTLGQLYNFLLKEADHLDFMKSKVDIDLLPSSNINYRDKIEGSIVGLALGDAFGSYLGSQFWGDVEFINSFLKSSRHLVNLNVTRITDMVIIMAESLIIQQKFCPGDMADRFIRQNFREKDDFLGEFTINYRDRKLEWYRSASEVASSVAALRTSPIALINYGDFLSLKLMAGIQASITHREVTTIASSIYQATAIAYLANLDPFSLRDRESVENFIDICGKSIKGIENKLGAYVNFPKTTSLYTRMGIEVLQALEKDIDIARAQEKWKHQNPVLEFIPLAIYIFLKSPNDFESILKNCLSTKNTGPIANLALSLGGAYLGYSNIPKAYVNKLNNLEEMLVLSLRLLELSLKNQKNNPYRRENTLAGHSKSADEINVLLWQGIKYNKEKDFANSVRCFESLLAEYPSEKQNEKIKHGIIEAYEGLGVKALGQERFSHALKIFKRALAYDLSNPTILCNLAITYLHLDDLVKAERYAQRAVEIAPAYNIGKEVLQAIRSIKK